MVVTELWAEHTPHICHILHERGTKEASAGVEDQKADEAEQEDSNKTQSIGFRVFHGGEPTSEALFAEAIQGV